MLLLPAAVSTGCLLACLLTLCDYPCFCCSAEKYGVEYVEPAKRGDLQLEARKERFNRPGERRGERERSGLPCCVVLLLRGSPPLPCSPGRGRCPGQGRGAERPPLQSRTHTHTLAGFATGVDLFTEEEIAKRAQRASRFGLPEGSGLQWKPPQVGVRLLLSEAVCVVDSRGRKGILRPLPARLLVTPALAALPFPLLCLQMDDDAEKRKQRAERFGVEYRPKDETGLMDVGAWVAGSTAAGTEPPMQPCCCC